MFPIYDISYIPVISSYKMTELHLCICNLEYIL